MNSTTDLLIARSYPVCLSDGCFRDGGEGVEVPTWWTIFMRARAQYGNFAGNFNWKLFTRFDLEVGLCRVGGKGRGFSLLKCYKFLKLCTIILSQCSFQLNSWNFRLNP